MPYLYQYPSMHYLYQYPSMLCHTTTMRVGTWCVPQRPTLQVLYATHVSNPGWRYDMVECCGGLLAAGSSRSMFECGRWH